MIGLKWLSYVVPLQSSLAIRFASNAELHNMTLVAFSLLTPGRRTVERAH